MNKIIVIVLLSLLGCSGNRHKGFLNSKYERSDGYETEKQTGTFKNSAGKKVIPDSSFVTTTGEIRSDRIPDEVFDRPDLKELVIKGMDCDIIEEGKVKHCWMIKEIPPQIKNLTHLGILRLPLNSISRLPDEIKALKNLKIIDLTDNIPLSNIDQLAELPELEEIYVFGCGILRLPENIGNLKKLKVFGLTGNPLVKKELDRAHKLLPDCNIVYEK